MLEFSGPPGSQTVNLHPNVRVLHGQGIEFAGTTGSQHPHVSDIQQVIHGLQRVLQQRNEFSGSTGSQSTINHAHTQHANEFAGLTGSQSSNLTNNPHNLNQQTGHAGSTGAQGVENSNTFRGFHITHGFKQVHTGSTDAQHASQSNDWSSGQPFSSAPLQSALIRPTSTSFANIQNAGNTGSENARAGIPSTFPGFIDPVQAQPVYPAPNPLFSNVPEYDRSDNNPSGKPPPPPPPPPSTGTGTANTAPAAANPMFVEGDGGDIVGGRRVRVKDIEIEPMPEAQKLRQWKTNMIETISDSCPHGFSWISELEAATTLEQLEANPYPELESRVSLAIKKAIKHDAIFHKRISQMIEEGHKTGKRIRSRQIMFLMYGFLKPHVRGESYYDLKDLLNCRLEVNPSKCSAKDLESFLIAWDNVISGMSNIPDSETMYTLFFSQIEGISAINFDLEIYKRLPERDKTYDRLRDVCENWIRVQRGEENQRRKHTRANQHLAVAGAGPSHRSSRSTSSERRRKGHTRGRSPVRTGSRHGSRSKSPGRSFSKGKSGRSHSNGKSGTKKPCIDFQKGKCTRGAGCKYEHSRDQGHRGHSPKRTPTPTRRGSTSPGGAGRRTPIQNANRVCHAIRDGKTCKWGDKCIYSHALPSAAGTPNSDSRKDGNRSANSPAPESFR